MRLLLQNGTIGTHPFWRLIRVAKLELAGRREPDITAATMRGDEYTLFAR